MARDKRGDYYRSYPLMMQQLTLTLTRELECSYRRLIDYYMLTGQPLPADDAALARIAGIEKTCWVSEKNLLGFLFDEIDGKWVPKFWSEVLNESKKAGEISSKNGKNGGRPKKKKRLKKQIVEEKIEDSKTCWVSEKNLAGFEKKPGRLLSGFEMKKTAPPASRARDRDNINIINNNNIKKNISPPLTAPPLLSQQAEEVLAHLNRVTGRSLEAATGTLMYIRARLRDGVPVEVLKAIIDHKWQDWQDWDQRLKKMHPDTLFCVRGFAKYLEEIKHAATNKNTRNLAKKGINSVYRENLAIAYGGRIPDEILEHYDGPSSAVAGGDSVALWGAGADLPPGLVLRPKGPDFCGGSPEDMGDRYCGTDAAGDSGGDTQAEDRPGEGFCTATRDFPGPLPVGESAYTSGALQLRGGGDALQAATLDATDAVQRSRDGPDGQ